MATRVIETTEHTCDGCGKRAYELDGAVPLWLYFDWFEHHAGGGDGGRLEACSERCVPRAVKRRREVAREAEEAARRLS